MTATMTKNYRPWGSAVDLWRSHDREILMDGPAGTGKTRAILEKLNLIAMKYPNCRILIVRKTRASCTESVLVTYESHVLNPASVIKAGAGRSNRQSYLYPNGSTIVVGGLDRIERILSTEYDVIWVNEATEISLDDWETLLTRLRNGKVPYQQAIADCNPSYPQHWLRARAEAGKMTRLFSQHEDNPTVTEDYLETLRGLSGHRRARLYEGKWVAAEGLIYEMFNESIHVKAIEKDWKRLVLGIDEGYTNPCSMHAYGLDEDDRIHVLEEWYQTKQLESTVVREAARLHETYGFEAIVVDPSAAKLIAALDEAGLPVQEANNDVFGGIREVQDRLDIQADGKPRLTIAPECQHMIEEIQSYQWKENRDGSRDDKPTKKNDHAMDEIRYVCAYVRENSGSFQVFSL